MGRLKQQSFLQGAMILTAATLLVKLIGALFKIPLTNILGGVGMSYFVTAYELFNPIYALTVTGMGVAVSRLVSEYTAKNQPLAARRVLRVSVGLFTLVGLGGALIIACFAGMFVRAVNNPLGLYSVYAIAPAMLFSCISSAFRGYYQGKSNMVPTAASQVVEAVVKLLCGISLSYGVVVYTSREYSTYGTIFGTPSPSAEQAVFDMLPFAAAAAILGVTLSTLAGCLYIILRHLFTRRGEPAPKGTASEEVPSTRLLLGRVWGIAVPVSLSAVVVNLTTLIDLASVMNRLETAIDAGLDTILEMYHGLIPQSMDLRMLPEYLFGSYSGLAVSIFNLVPALTTAFAISALPFITASWAVGNRKATRKNIESVLRVTLLLAFPAGLGIFALSGPILNLLFSGRAMEAVIIAPVLRVMGISAILVSVTTTVNSMLQAVGLVKLPVKLMIAGGVIKLITNYCLVAVPSINIQGVPYGTLFCYLFIVGASLFALCRKTGVTLHLSAVVLRPLGAGAICATAAYLSYGILSRLSDSRLITLAAIAIGGLAYLAALLALGCIQREDLQMLPMGEKIQKMLEKHGFIM